MDGPCFYMAPALKKNSCVKRSIFYTDTLGQGKDKALLVNQQIPSLVIQCPHLPFAPPVMYSQELAWQGHPGLLAAAWLGCRVPSCRDAPGIWCLISLNCDTDSHCSILSTALAMASSKAVKYKRLASEQEKKNSP